MIDMHTHILPGVDDGSRSIEESLQMLRLEAAQGVTHVALTPHFYALEDSPQRFLERRQRAFEELTAHWTPELPRLLPGAEVQYFEGISSAERMTDLRLQGTKLLLLEMPFRPWTERMIDEVLELNHRQDVQVVLAHVERYLRWQDRDMVPWLVDNGLMLQCNAGGFLDLYTRGKTLRMLREGMVHMLGSDCHDLTVRPPKMGEAWEKIQKKLGAAAADRFKEYSDLIFQQNSI